MKIIFNIIGNDDYQKKISEFELLQSTLDNYKSICEKYGFEYTFNIGYLLDKLGNDSFMETAKKDYKLNSDLKKSLSIETFMNNYISDNSLNRHPVLEHNYYQLINIWNSLMSEELNINQEYTIQINCIDIYDTKFVEHIHHLNELQSICDKWYLGFTGYPLNYMLNTDKLYMEYYNERNLFTPSGVHELQKCIRKGDTNYFNVIESKEIIIKT